jgi:hypothetical protein
MTPQPARSGASSSHPTMNQANISGSADPQHCTAEEWSTMPMPFSIDPSSRVNECVALSKHSSTMLDSATAEIPLRHTAETGHHLCNRCHFTQPPHPYCHFTKNMPPGRKMASTTAIVQFVRPGSGVSFGAAR